MIINKNVAKIEEIVKMFMNQISSLKKLDYKLYYSSIGIPDNIPLTLETNCLKDLSELCCGSDIGSEFFHQLSQICHNLQSLAIRFGVKVSDGLNELITSQNNLKSLSLSIYEQDVGYNWSNIIPNLTKHSNTLTKLYLSVNCDYLPLSFISSFSNLHTIFLSYLDNFNYNFKALQYVDFPKLQTLKIPDDCPSPMYLIKFLEINGKHIEEIYIGDNDDGVDALSSSIAKFCPNLKRLSVLFGQGEIDILRDIFNKCQYLESMVISHKEACNLGEEEMLKVIAMHSPKNFYELKYFYPELSPEDLESFFINWKNRMSNKLLSLFIIKSNDYEINEDIMKVIKKYECLGVIKKFETKFDGDEEFILGFVKLLFVHYENS